MEEIIETKQLEFDKSTFLLDLVKHSNGNLYVEIIQTINNNETVQSSIKINPSVLSDIIQVLQYYESKTRKRKNIESDYLTKDENKKIIDRYLKGVSIKDLSLQFDKSEDLIEMILRNKEIKIVSQEIPKKKYWRKRKK
jgi:hypothetical protein